MQISLLRLLDREKGPEQVFIKPMVVIHITVFKSQWHDVMKYYQDVLYEAWKQPSSSCAKSHIANLGRFLRIRVRGSKIMCLPSQASPVFAFFPVNFSRKTLWLREDLSLHWVVATARFLAARSSSLVTWRSAQKLASDNSKVHSLSHNILEQSDLFLKEASHLPVPLKWLAWGWGWWRTLLLVDWGPSWSRALYPRHWYW